MMKVNRATKGLVAIFLVGIFFLSTKSKIYGDSISSQLQIQANVAPVLEYTIEIGQSSIEIKVSDLDKGYVDVSNGEKLTVMTNNPNGYMIYVDSSDPGLFTSVTIETKEKKTFELFPGGGVEIIYPHNTSEKKDKESLSYRFHLKSDVEPGVYPWPITVSVNTI